MLCRTQSIRRDMCFGSSEREMAINHQVAMGIVWQSSAQQQRDGGAEGSSVGEQLPCPPVAPLWFPPVAPLWFLALSLLPCAPTAIRSLFYFPAPGRTASPCPWHSSHLPRQRCLCLISAAFASRRRAPHPFPATRFPE